MYAPDEYKYLQRYIDGTSLTTSEVSQEDWETQTWVDYNVVSTSDESRADILNAFGAQNKALLEYNRPLTFAYDSSIKTELKSLFTELQSIVPMSSGYLDPTDDENDGKVSGNVGYVLLVPMTSINTGSIDNIILNVNLDNLIKEITDNTSDADFDYNVEYSLDSDGSPVSYSLTTD